MIDFGLFSAAAFAENNGQPADIYEFTENKLASEPCLCAFAPLREILIDQPCVARARSCPGQPNVSCLAKSAKAQSRPESQGERSEAKSLRLCASARDLYEASRDSRASQVDFSLAE